MSDRNTITMKKTTNTIKRKFGDITTITWIDACEVSRWKSFSDAIKIPDEVFCHTTGYFLNQTKDMITIAHTIGLSENNDVLGVMHIPLHWIQKIV